jgi:hypothetical protein
MRRTSLTYKLVSLLAIIFILAGTTGFVVSSHTCSSCGVHEAQVSMFGTTAGDSHVCTSSESQTSCCSTEPDIKAATCCQIPSDNPANNIDGENSSHCNIIGEEPCCQYETGLVIIDTFNSEKSRTAIQLPGIEIPDINSSSPVQSEPIAAVTVFHNKHAGTPPDIMQLICCYRI